MASRQATDRVPGQLIPETMSPYKRPRPQSPHAPPRDIHGFIGYPDQHRFTMASNPAHFSALYQSQASRDHVRHHVQELPHMGYPDPQRDVQAYASHPLQTQLKRRPSLLSDIHGHAGADRDGRREGYYHRSFEPLRIASGNHHPENDISAAKRRRLETENNIKFRPVPEAVRQPATTSHQDIKKEPFIPKVENVSPTPCDEESPSKVSKEGLLQSMEKVDREIATVESQIHNLSKKKQELEARAAQQPVKGGEENVLEQAEPKQQNPVQIIYAENRKKAEAAHKVLDIYGTKHELPLYNQPSDNPKYQEVLKNNYELSRKFIQFLKRQQQERRLREQQQCQVYNKRMEKWEKGLDQLDASGKNRSKDAKVREFFEKQFPEIRKQREQQERFSRAGTRSWGNIARSDAELAEIVDNLNEQEASERHMRSLTVIPPLLLDAEQRRVKFINENGIVEDAMQVHKDRQKFNLWSEEEKEIFREKYFQHPKNFGVIASFLERKSVADCVLYYYNSKKNENYKQRKSQMKRRRNYPPKNTSSNISRNQEEEEKEEKEESNPQESKNKEGGSLKEGVIEGHSQKDDTTNGPPMSAPTNCALCRHSLDAYTLSRPLSRANCELLGLSENEITSNMRVCSKCRFKSMRKSRCPVTSCKTARRKPKRLKPLPTKWHEISSELRSVISEEIGLTPEVTRCCPACFNRIVRRLCSEGSDNTTSTSSITSAKVNENHNPGVPETDAWSEKETTQLKEGMKIHGKQWTLIAKMVGTKTELECKNCYLNHAEKQELDQILEEHKKKKVQREHRISTTDSVASTVTAASEDDIVPFSDGDHDADESSDTASASENEEEPLQKLVNASTDNKTKTNTKPEEAMEIDKNPKEGEEDLRTSNDTHKIMGDISGDRPSKPSEIKSAKVENVDDGDSSATCSADEGHPHDPDLPFSENSKHVSPTLPTAPPTQAIPASITNRVSSSDDDTKLSELRVKLGGEDHPSRTGSESGVTSTASRSVANEVSCNSDATKTVTTAEAENGTEDAEDQMWEKQGIRNMKDLIDSAIHRHLGQERGSSPKLEKKDKENTVPSATNSRESPTLISSPATKDANQPVPQAPLTEKRTENHSGALHPELMLNSDKNALMLSSHISHLVHSSEKDIYDSAQRQSPKSRSPGKNQISPASLDPMSNRYPYEQTIEREPNRLASPSGVNPSGRHTYSPKSSGSPYTLVPAHDHHLAGPRPLQRSTKPCSVPPPPPLSKLSPKGIKTEQLSPHSQGRHHTSIHSGSILSGTPVNFSRSSGSPMRIDGPHHKQPYSGLLTTAPTSSPPTSRHEVYGAGSITQGTPLVRRDLQQGIPNNRTTSHQAQEGSITKGTPISPDILQRMQLKPEHFPAFEAMRGIRVYPAMETMELARAALEKGGVDQTSALYMYTQRHPMGYGDYNPGLVRGQYESGAYSSSKETLAGDFQTAKQMRMPHPVSSQPGTHKDPRHSPRHELPHSKRSSPGHLTPAPEGIPQALLRYSHPHQGIMFLPPYILHGAASLPTSPHLIQQYPAGSSPSLPSPRSPHSSTQHPSSALTSETRPQKTHSPSVHHRDGQIIPSDMSRSWPRAQQGHFRPASRGVSPGVTMPGSGPYGMRVPNATSGSIMHGTPMWHPGPSIVSGTPNPDLRDRKVDRGPSPSRTKSPKTSRGPETFRSEVPSRSEMGSSADRGLRPDHLSRTDHGVRSDHNQRSDHSHVSQEKDARQTPNNHLMMNIEMGHQRRAASSPGVNRERVSVSAPSQMEKKQPSTSRPSSHSQDGHMIQQHKREAMERLKREQKEKPGAPDSEMINAIFGPQKAESEGHSLTAATLLDHIIHRQINHSAEEDAASQVVSQPPPPPSSQTSSPGSQSGISRSADSILNQFIVSQIKKTSEDERTAPDSQNHPGSKTEKQGRQPPSTYASRHENEIRGSVTSSKQQIGNSALSGSNQLRSISIGDHIASIVSKECNPGTPHHPQHSHGIAQVDSTNSYLAEHSRNESRTSRVNELKGHQGETARPDSSNMHAKLSNEALPADKENQNSRVDSTAHEGHINSRPTSTSRISPLSQNHQSPDRANERASEANSRPPSSHENFTPNRLSPGFHQGGVRDQNRTVSARAESSVIRTSPHNSSHPVSSSRHINTAQLIFSNAMNNVNMSSKKNPSVTINFQESINRMIETQVRMTDFNASTQRHPQQDARNANYHNDRTQMEKAEGRVEKTKASSMPIRKHMSMSNLHINNDEYHSNKDSNVHSSNMSSSPPQREHGTYPGIPPSSQPGYQPGNPFPYSALSFQHMSQTQAAGQHRPMMRTPSPHMIPGQRASPAPGPGMVPGHAPLLSANYEDLSDSD